jgi:hypothetical protein
VIEVPVEHIVYQDMAVPVERVTTTEVTQEVPVERVVERLVASMQRRDLDGKLLSYNQTRADAAARHSAYGKPWGNVGGGGGGGGHRPDGAPQPTNLDID